MQSEILILGSNKKLLVTSASLLVTSALLVVTRSQHKQCRTCRVKRGAVDPKDIQNSSEQPQMNSSLELERFFQRNPGIKPLVSEV